MSPEQDWFSTNAPKAGASDDWFAANAKPLSAATAAPDPRSSGQVAWDQVKAVGSGIGIPTSIDQAKGIASQALEHPIDTLWNVIKGTATLPVTAVKDVGESTIPAIVKNTAALREAWGGPRSPFGPAATRPEDEAAARGAGEALGAAPVGMAEGKVASSAWDAIQGKMLKAPSVNRWMGVTAKDMEHGVDPGQQLIDEKLIGSTKVETKANVDRTLAIAGNNIGQKMAQAEKGGVVIDAQKPVMDGLADATKKIGLRKDTAFQAQLSNVLDDVLQRYPNIDKLTPADTLALKTEIGRSIKWTGAPYEGDINQALINIYKNLNEKLKADVKPVVGDISPELSRYGNLAQASNALETSLLKDKAGTGSGAAAPGSLRKTVKTLAPYALGAGTAMSALDLLGRLRD